MALIFTENRTRATGLSVTTNKRVGFASNGLPEASAAEVTTGTAANRYISPRRLAAVIPPSSTDNVIARYDGTTGHLQTSGITIDDSNVISGGTFDAEVQGESIQAFTEDTAPDFTVDYIPSYDDSADTGKKLKLTTVVREKLTATRNYYVRTDGSDSNTGLANTSGGAFLTIQKAVDTVFDKIDCQSKVVVINVGSGTFAGDVIVYGPFVGDIGNVFLIGAGSSSTILDSTDGSAAISVTNHGKLNIQSLRVQSTGAVSQGIEALDHGQIFFNTIDFGVCAAHIYSDRQGYIESAGNWTISGSPTDAHLHISHLGGFRALSKTCTINANMTMTYFAHAYAGGDLTMQSCTITNSGAFTITAKRFDAAAGGMIYTAGSGLTFFPGTTAGTFSSGTYDDTWGTTDAGIGTPPTSTSYLTLGAGTTAISPLRFLQGAAPTSPVDGDVWREDNTNTGLKVRINGVTKTITVS